jgi:uncharacterized protein (DUF1697 family)
MPRYAAFLRGVNLGAQRKTPVAELRTCFEGVGLEEVQTFRTSGNVVFDAGRAPKGDRIEKALRDSFGFEVDVYLRTAAEVRAIAGHEPFPAKLVAASDGKLQVAMLQKKAAAATRKRALALADDDNRLAFEGRELYWLPSGGIRNSAPYLKPLEQLVGQWTMRTKGTVEALAAKYFA